jgi:competence CoiA-like predicted nuclease
MVPSALPQYTLYCPEHPRQKIGIVLDIKNPHFAHGFWCKECKEPKFFDENNIKKHLKLSQKPCRVRQNLTQMREDARA